MNKQDMRASARIAAGARGLAPVDALSAMRLLSAMAIFVLVCLFCYAILTGVESITTLAALTLLVILVLAFIYAFLTPDTLRSQYTEQTLAVASEMLEDIKANVEDWSSDDAVASYLEKIVRKQAGDRSGLIYGMGHAVYTLSDPRAVMLKRSAKALAEEKGFMEEFELIESVERLTPAVFTAVKGDRKVVSANVDLYSGFVYKMLGIPAELCTPLFAIARIVGWSAHRIEELLTCGRIMRPAYKSIAENGVYVPIAERG